MSSAGCIPHHVACRGPRRTCMCVPIHPRLLSQPCHNRHTRNYISLIQASMRFRFLLQSVAVERGAFQTPEPVRYMLKNTGSVLVSTRGVALSCLPLSFHNVTIWYRLNETMLLKLSIPKNHFFCVKVGVAATRKSLLGVVGYHAVLTPQRPRVRSSQKTSFFGNLFLGKLIRGL